MGAGERRRRRAAAAALAVVAVAGLAVSVGQAMGGQGLGGASLGSSSDVVGSCVSSAINASLDVEYSAALRGYGVTGAQLSGLPASCEGSNLRVAFTGRDGALLAEVVVVGSSPQTPVRLPDGSPLAVDAVSDVAIVATDAAPTVQG